MSTSGVVIHYIEWGCQSPNPRKYIVLDGNSVFDLHNVFQEHIPDVNRDLPVQTYVFPVNITLQLFCVKYFVVN